LALYQSSKHFSTDSESLSRQDMDKLKPFIGKYLYIDALCSTKQGVGTLLVLASYQVALQQKAKGLIALAFSPRRGGVPDSAKIFDALRFDKVIPTANFKVQLYGTWYAKGTDEVAIADMVQDASRICTRNGLTPASSGSLISRCPAL